MSRELDVLKKKPRTRIPRAVVVQDGGPKGTRHEGFKDAPVFLRGNSKRLGKTVPRGVPRDPGRRSASRQMRITKGSGRLELAEWLARSRQPADGPRHGQPDLAAPLRRGPGPHRPTTSASAASGRQTLRCSTGWPRGSWNRGGR